MEHFLPHILGAGAVRPGKGCPTSDVEANLRVQVKELEAYLPPSGFRRMPLYARMGLLAVVRAVRSAGMELTSLHRAALVVGSAYSCQKTSLDFMDSILDDGPGLASPIQFSLSVNNMAAGLASISLGIRGPCCTVNTGELSFAGAIQTAHTVLLNGDVDLALVGMMDEADGRFCRLFPERRAVPAAIFFLLGMGDSGPAFSVEWAGGNKLSDTSLSAALLCHDAWASGRPASALVGEPWACTSAKISMLAL